MFAVCCLFVCGKVRVWVVGANLTGSAENEALDDPDSVQTLWKLGLEALAVSVKVWRGYGSRNKEQKIRLGLSIVRAAMDMMSQHEDVKTVRESREKMQQLLRDVQSQ